MKKIISSSVFAVAVVFGSAHADDMSALASDPLAGETPLTLEELQAARGGIEIAGLQFEIGIERVFGFQELSLDGDPIFDSAEALETTLATANSASTFANAGRRFDIDGSPTFIINNTRNDFVVALNNTIDVTTFGFDLAKDIAIGAASIAELVVDSAIIGTQF